MTRRSKVQARVVGEAEARCRDGRATAMYVPYCLGYEAYTLAYWLSVMVAVLLLTSASAAALVLLSSTR